MKIIKTALEEWEDRNFPDIISRSFGIEKYISSKSNKIIVLEQKEKLGLFQFINF